MDPLEQARLFLDRFQANVNLQDPLPIRVPIYHLKHDEIEPAIVEWTRTYLDQFECPQCLLTPITRIVVDAVLKRCEESPQSCGYDSDVADYKPLQFNQEVISRVNATCMELLDNVRLNNLLATMRPQQTMDEPDSVPNGVHDSGHSMRPFYVSKGFKNKRRTMEDRHVCLPDFNKLFQTRDTEPTAFYGVYDGHGGQDAASFATSHLHYYIAQSKHYPHDMAQAFQEGFVKTDRLFCGKGEDHFLNSGSTAVVCFHRIASRQVDVAWVGDSQAMIVKRTPGSNLYNQLVHPTHSPNNPDERERIQAIGGAVMFWYGNYRVNGQLAVSRAIGNRQAKPYVSADPGISLNKLTEDDLFLVMASDGLWDACNEYFISMFVLYALRMFPNEPQKINDYLITCAKQKSSDNITVIIVFLKDPQTIIKETPFVEELEVKAKHRAAQEKNMNNATSNGLLAENTSIPLEDHKAFDDIQNFMLESAMVEPKSAASSLCVGPVDDMGFLSDGGLGPETDVDGLHESKQSPSPMLLAEQDEEEDEEQSLHRAVQAVGNGDTEHETASVGSVDTATAADYNPFGTGVESSNVLVVESPNALEVDINDSHADIEEEDPTSPSSVSADPVDLSEDHGSDLNVPHVNGTGLGASEYDHHECEDGAAYAGDVGNEQQDEVEVNQKPALMSEEIVPLMKSIDEPIVNDLLGADAIVDNKLIDQLDSFGISEAIRRQLIEQQVTGAPMHHHEHDEDDDDGQLVLEEKHSELDGAEKEDLHHEKAFDSDYGNDLQSADVKQDDDAGCCEDSEEDEWDYVKVNKQQAQELETTTPSDHAEFGNTKSDDSAEQQQHRFDQQDPEEERQVERLLDQEVAQAEQQKPKEEEQEEETEVEEYKQNNIDDEQQLPQEPQQQQQQLEENSEPEFNQQPKDEEAVLFDQQELEQQQQQQQQEEEEETTVVPSIAETEQQATDILGDSSAAYSTEPVGVNETDDVISGGGVATEVVNLLNDSKEEIPQPTTAETTPSPLPGDTYEEQQPEEVAEERFESQQAEILSSANTMETSMFGGSLSGQSPMSPESPLTPVQDSNLVAQEKDLFGANAQDLVMDVHSASSPADEELNEKHMYETEEKAMHLAGAGAAGDMMGWQLNPEAKEFVPPCAAGTVLNAESTPFTPPRMLEHENFKLRDDAIVAQSPRKGAASSLEDMDLPQENDFQTEMGKRPHEFELEAENGVGEPISEQARVISPLTSPPMFEELREEVPATNGEHGGLYGQQVDADAVSGDIELLNKVQELPDGEEDVTQQEQQDTYAAEPIAPSPAFAEDVQVNLMETEPSSAKEEQYVEQKETVDESPIQTLGSDFVQDFSQLSFNNGYGTGDATTYGANPFLQQEIEAPVAPTVAEDVSPSYDAPSVVKEEVAVEALVAPVSESKPVEPVAVEAVSSPTPEPIPTLAVTETTPEVVVEEQKPEDKPLIETTPSQDNASSVAPIAVAAAAATAAVAAVGVAAATAASNKTAKPKVSAPTVKKPSGTASAPAKAAPAAASKVTASRVSASSTTTAAAARKPPTSAPLAVKKAPIAAKTTPTMNGGTKEARPASAASTKSTTLSAKTTKPAAAKPAASNNSTSSVAAARAKASSTTSSTTTKAASATGSSTTRTAPKLSAATAGAGGKTTTTTTSSRLSTVGSAARPASATSRPSSAISEKSTTVPSKPATTVKRTVAAKSTVTNGTSVTDGTTKQTKTTTSSSSTTTSATSRASTVPKTSTLTAKKPAATSAGSTTTAKATTTAKSTSLTATSKTTTATRTSLAPRPTAGAATSPTARKLQNGTAAVPKKMAASPTPIVIRKPGTVAKKDQQQQQQQKVKEEVASSETASATTVTTTTTTTTMAVESTIVSEGGGDVPNAAAAIDLLVAQNDQLVPHAM
ncbi:protein piccolo-like [Anopheles aquasalis]|uniref:protein piccolo-like n=1 Tax=Anopheles aquasalis TaxID=42839 RepID=UPI00215A8715|nr:protein piccolo-like [Anopheles aquasalis]